MVVVTLINAIEKILGRGYTNILDNNGVVVPGIAGIDYPYIISSLFLLVATIFFIKALFKFLESIFMLRR